MGLRKAGKKEVNTSVYQVEDILYAKEDCMNNFTKGQSVVVTEQTSPSTYVIDGVVELEGTDINKYFSKIPVLPDVENRGVASTEFMEKTLVLVADKFNLGGDYIMTAFADGGVKCSVTMSSTDFEVTVKVKNTEKQGLRKFD